MVEGPSQRLRLFVACELPDEVRQALERLQDDLRRRIPERLRWVRPEAIHLTLKFLGAVESSKLEPIRAALENAVTPFELHVRPASVGGFGGARLRVVWVGLEGDVEGLADLASRIETALEPAGFPRERRPFAAHLTLARVPDEASADVRRKIASLIQTHGTPNFSSMTLTRVSLVRSHLRPDGAVYERLAAFPGGAERLTR